MNNIDLRYYQHDGLNAIWQYFLDGNTGNPVLAWPTGTGKSILPAVFIKQVMQIYPTQRFLLVTHVSELIKQNYEVMLEIWPNAPIGIYSAGLKQRDINYPIIYGGVQSMVKKPMLFGHRDIIFIDEGHLVNQDDSSMYQTFLGYMKAVNPQVKIIGLTATPFRMGQGLITDGTTIFTDIIHDITNLDNFNRLISESYLAPLIPLRTRTELDVSNVGIRNSEYIPGQLQSAVDKDEITNAALREVIAAGENRKSWLIFSSGIEHAEHISNCLNSFGIDCASVHSKRPSDYCDNAIKEFKAGNLRSIVNYSKLTTGFNHPSIDLLVDLRPTMSIPLHIQKLGRGTRPAHGKENCIAKGSLVLTDQGLIPIEKITIEMKLWDGVEYVSHKGVICKGYQNVIEYEGLHATPEHLVYTRRGWKSFKEASLEQIPIAITGIGRTPIRKIDNYFSGNSEEIQGWPRKTLFFNKMFNLFLRRLERFKQFTSINCRLSQMRQSYALASYSKMASKSMYWCERSMHQYKQQKLQKLRWKRNTIQIRYSYSNGGMDSNKFGVKEKFRNRQNRQQWSLRNWKFKIFYIFRKYEQQKKNISKKLQNGFVYDILNCGPRNRFTVNGLLVHNCLVLDFARNVPRLGPINDPIIPRKKGEKTGDPPIKICENCGAYNHASVRICCNCGEEFIFKVKIVAKSGVAEIIKSDLPTIEIYDVNRVVYVKHNKVGSPPSMRVSYFCGLHMFHEWICIEHNGLAGKKARDWWRQTTGAGTPMNVDQALEHVSNLRTPKRIKVIVNRKYPEIVGREF